MNDERIKEAIHAVIAKTILEGIDTEARDALLQKSITDAISDYSFRVAIEKVVAEKAKAVVSEMVETEEWTLAIEGAIRAGFDGYIRNLRIATEKLLKVQFHGKDGSYASSGNVLRCWPESKASD